MRGQGDDGDNYYWSHWLLGRVELGYGQPDRPATKEDPRVWAEKQVSKASDFEETVNSELSARYQAALTACGNHSGVVNIQPDDPPGLRDISCNNGSGCFTDDSCEALE